MFPCFRWDGSSRCIGCILGQYFSEANETVCIALCNHIGGKHLFRNQPASLPVEARHDLATS